jgi:hypothetical protein
MGAEEADICAKEVSHNTGMGKLHVDPLLGNDSETSNYTTADAK